MLSVRLSSLGFTRAVPDQLTREFVSNSVTVALLRNCVLQMAIRNKRKKTTGSEGLFVLITVAPAKLLLE